MDALNKYWFTLKRRKFPVLAIFGSVFLFTAVNAFNAKPVYEAEGQLLLKRISTSTAALGTAIGQIDDLGRINSPLNTETEIIRSIPIAQKTIQALQKANEFGIPNNPKAFLAPLRVRNLVGTDILQVSYQDIDPTRAAKVVNTLLQVYIAEDIKTNRTETQSAREFIEKQLPKVEVNVQKAEQALRRFKESNRIVSLDSESASTITTVKNLEGQVASVQVDLATATARSNQLQSSLGMNAQIASVITSPSVETLFKQWQEIEQSLALERTRLQANHPTIVDLETKRNALQNLMRQRVTQGLLTQLQSQTRGLQLSPAQQASINDLVRLETERVGLANRQQALQAILNNYEKRTAVYPKLEQQQRDLERQLKASQLTYEALLGKLQEVRVAENQTQGNTRIVAPALIPDTPISASREVGLIRGAILAAICAAIAIAILEATDKSIRTIEQVRLMVDYPVLGIIPSFKHAAKSIAPSNSLLTSSRSIIVRDTPRSGVSEAFRMLLTNLKFLNSDKPVRVIVISSSVPKEGKSTVTSNLATAMSQLDKKVLVIDADLRKPQQHRVWELPNAVGLSNVITGQSDFQRAKQTVMPNLDVLTSGILPPNPVALLDSQRMAALIKFASNHYDFILVDSPPLTTAADASILGKIADGLLLVVRTGISDTTSFNFSKQLVEQSGQNILGLIVNGVVPENDSYFSYYYYVNEYYETDNIPTSGSLPPERKSKST